MAIQLRHRVLIVDDDSGIRNLTSVVLQLNDYDVSAAENGLEAVNVLKKKTPHVMISDIKMPYMDGYELLRLARRVFPAMGAIVLSAMEETAAPGKELADAVFVKADYKLEDLLACISNLAARYPLRGPSMKSPVSQSWVANGDHQHFWAVCNDCLTCFSLPLSQLTYSGMHIGYCPLCGHRMRFTMKQATPNLMPIAA